jgi:putative pantetheine hydrolase
MPVIEIRQISHVGPRNDITDIAGIRVGHYQRIGDGWLTGTTVILPPAGTVASVDVRGGGPSTRESDALDPTTLTGEVHAVCLSGGSSYGLATADGVMRRLEANGVGFRVGLEPHMVVPIVPSACLFDLIGGGEFAKRPDATFGEAAFDAASDGPVAQGNVGAGTGGHAGNLKGGIGSASVVLPSGVTVAALAALNSGGNVADPETGEIYGVRYGLPDEFISLATPSAADLTAAKASVAASPRNTVLVVVATDAALTKTECRRVAMSAHDGLARSITPVHCMTDGDIIFALSTRSVPLAGDAIQDIIVADSNRPHQLDEIMAAGANAVARAIVHAVLAATSTMGMTAYLDRYPSARISAVSS